MKIHIINSRFNLKNQLSTFVENKKIQLISFNTIDNTNSPNQFKIFKLKNNSLTEKSIDLSINSETKEYENHFLGQIIDCSKCKFWIEPIKNDNQPINERIAFELNIKIID